MNLRDRNRILGYLQAALDDPHAGIALDFLTQDDAGEFRRRTYPVQKEHPEYSSLILKITGSQLWIIRGRISEDAKAE